MTFQKGYTPYNKGKKLPPFSDEHKRKMSETAKRIGTGKWTKGKHWKRKPFTIKHRQKLSISRRKEKHWNWQGGIARNPYPIDWTDDLKESIRKRDNYICQLCGIHQDELDKWIRKLDVHHIDYNKDNLNPENLIILCHSCHTKTNYKRDYWIKYFNN